MRQRDMFQIVHANDPVPLAALARKLDPVNREKKNGKEQAQALLTLLVISNTCELPSSLPQALRYHAFELVHNAVVTRDRMKYHGLSLKPECALCGELTETLAHLHTVCRASRMAVDRILSKSKGKSAVTILCTATRHA